MEVKVLDLSSGNPFQHFPEDLKYKKQETLDIILRNLLQQLGLNNNISALEIGSGNNRLPSQALDNLGAKVVTLDLDWQPARDNLSYEEYMKLRRDGRKALIPTFYGKDPKVKSFLGDLAFLDDKESQLRNEKFDFIFFYNSMYTNGLNQTVDCSTTARYFDVKIPLSQRVLKVNTALNPRGVILATAENFTEQYDKVHGTDIVKCVGWMNCKLTQLLLYWAVAGANLMGRKPSQIGLIGQTKESLGNRFSKHSEKQLERALYYDPINEIIRDGYEGLFGNENNYRNLLEASTILPREERSKLAVIDAVFVKY